MIRMAHLRGGDDQELMGTEVMQATIPLELIAEAEDRFLVLQIAHA